jgi:hypothetical protein
MNWISTRRRAASLLAALAFTVVLSACGGDDDDDGNNNPPDGQVPDFALTDVNPNSTTHDQDVSPRDYLGQVSAWYFGAAT